jgi:hypothetical protein
MEGHNKEKMFKCEKCNKVFFLEWGRNQHMKMHIYDVKHCYFFNNKKECPFESIGCMFLHRSAQMCTYNLCENKLCQFQHDDLLETQSEQEVETDNYKNEIQPFSDVQTVHENKCHLCMNKLESWESLFIHVERFHEEYFSQAVGMMSNLNSVA